MRPGWMGTAFGLELRLVLPVVRLADVADLGHPLGPVPASALSGSSLESRASARLASARMATFSG